MLDSLIETLISNGPMGTLAGVGFGVSLYLFRALRNEQSARLEDVKRFAEEMLDLQQKVTDTIERLESLLSKRQK